MSRLHNQEHNEGRAPDQKKKEDTLERIDGTQYRRLNVPVFVDDFSDLELDITADIRHQRFANSGSIIEIKRTT